MAPGRWSRRAAVAGVVLLPLTGVAPPALAQGTPVERAALAACLDRTRHPGVMLMRRAESDTTWGGHARRADDPLIPASTFKVFSALAALQAGVVDDAGSVIAWDGVVRERTELNRDLDLRTAFQLSAVPHFQQMVRQVGPVRLKRWLDAVGYGNADTSGGATTFWLVGGLRITPRQQLEFLDRLRRGALPFSAAAQGTVRDIMIVERDGDAVLRAKTGLATPPGMPTVGWWVGWVERDGAAWLFAVALQAGRTGDAGLAEARIAAGRCGLAALGVWPSMVRRGEAP